MIFAVLIAHAPVSIACNEHDLEDPSLVQVLQPSLTTSKSDGPVLVTVIGTFKNTSPNRVENLVVEAKLTDAQGKVIDVLTQPVYGVAVAAGQEVAFRVQGQAAAAQASYSGVQVRVAMLSMNRTLYWLDNCLLLRQLRRPQSRRHAVRPNLSFNRKQWGMPPFEAPFHSAPNVVIPHCSG
ncbi:FxLYD domain-containing protein [Piscinibacter sakaiensis]|uniref:FxLYD domain-containing protein n=1 Tax=Piscinibacter sakaiensis TaxID=1547922 RepID=UPI0018D02A8F|nr:FxLYD domain-containing protein [Piscinibacter sakaiensis]